MNTHELGTLAHIAVLQLLAQQPMTITHTVDWERNGFPLPIKKEPKNMDGTRTQAYRPMAVLEYVQEVLSGEMTSRRIRDRKAEVTT